MCPFEKKNIDFLKELKQSMQDDMENESLTEQLLSLFENNIIKSAKEVADIRMQQKTDWFAQSECILMIHSDLRNEV